MKIEDAIEKLSKDKKRKFEQSYDIIINLKNIDLKRPENKVSKELTLPHGRGKPASVFIISEKTGFDKKKLDELAARKKEAKALAKKYDFFIATADLMPAIGKTLGRYLAPLGKMPQPVPPTMPQEQIEKFSKAKQKNIKLRVKNTPVFQVIVGSESMKPDEVAENVNFVIKEAISLLPKGRAQIKNVYVKKTMGKPEKVDL